MPVFFSTVPKDWEDPTPDEESQLDGPWTHCQAIQSFNANQGEALSQEWDCSIPIQGRTESEASPQRQALKGKVWAVIIEEVTDGSMNGVLDEKWWSVRVRVLISTRMSGKIICLGVISRSIGANECLSVIGEVFCPKLNTLNFLKPQKFTTQTYSHFPKPQTCGPKWNKYLKYGSWVGIYSHRGGFKASGCHCL